MTPQDAAARFHELGARRDALVASLAPQEAVVAARVAEIEALKETLRPLASALNLKKAPLYAIDMERAEIARRLSGKTGGGRTFPRTARTGAEIIPFIGPSVDAEQLEALAVRLEGLEGVKEQTMTALETIVQTVQIERQKRQKLEDVILTLAERADETLRTKE